MQNRFMTNKLGSFLLAGSLCLFTFAACNKDDDNNNNNNIVEKKGIVLSGSQEVPTNSTTASGTADVSYNKTTKKLSFTLNWSNLSGEPTGAHIHGAAARGSNAGVKFDFFDAIPKTTSGSYSSSTTVDGTQIKEDSLLLGFYYFNIHTPTNKGGEIRGQIEF